MPPQLTRVIRLDSLPLNQTYFTAEGYLIDRPVVTSTGIFEYANADGTVRRELRTPEEVFDSESLKSYKGKPVIITHDAGLITKDNVRENQIGTILTEGYRNGEDVRAEIVIHDTDSMKHCKLKELSLGYNLDLDETPGVWNGQHYDAVQRNIRINHLALVREARAGDQARLNIDSRDQTTLKGGKRMSKTMTGTRADSVLSPDELETAIAEYKARRAKCDAGNPFGNPEPAEQPAPAVENAPAGVKPNPFPEKKDADNPVEKKPNPFEKKPNPFEKKEEPAPVPVPPVPQPEEPVKDGDGEEPAPVAGTPVTDPEQTFQDVKERNGDVDDSDYQLLCDIIDTLLAQHAYDCALQKDCGAKVDGDQDNPFGDNGGPAPQVPGEPEKTDADDDPADTVPAPNVVPPASPEPEKDPLATDDEDVPEQDRPDSPLNTDSADTARTWLQIGMAARDLHLDGLENMDRMGAMKTIINAVTPALRLDGKSDTFVAACFERAMLDVKSRTRRDVTYQYEQAFNGRRNRDARTDSADDTSAQARRKAMIQREYNKTI